MQTGTRPAGPPLHFNKYTVWEVGTHFGLTPAAASLHRLSAPRRRRNEKECRDCRVIAARPIRPARYAVVFVDRPPPMAGRNLRARAFLLPRTRAWRGRGRRCRSRRRGGRGGCGKEFCSRGGGENGKPVF